MDSQFRDLHQPLSNNINVDGKDYLYFGGTAYLGIPQNMAFINLYMQGIQKYGLNNGTSRNNNIQLGIYSEAEQVAAERFGAESAIVTSSGYLAAQLTVQEFANFGEIEYAPNTHPALWLKEPLHTHLSFSEWKIQIVNKINSSEEKNWVLISNSMNNLVPEIYDFQFLKHIAAEKNIILIIDDSHGIGVNNSGLSAMTALPKAANITCVVVASMAKALGVDAGLVLSKAETINILRATNIFAGASPPAAAALYAFIHADKIYKSEWDKLQKNINLFNSKINSSWIAEHGFPAFLTYQASLAEKLLENGVLISSFPYPTKDSPAINRIVLSSWHTEANISRLARCIDKLESGRD